jgi:hypothetical protein
MPKKSGDSFVYKFEQMARLFRQLEVEGFDVEGFVSTLLHADFPVPSKEAFQKGPNENNRLSLVAPKLEVDGFASFYAEDRFVLPSLVKADVQISKIDARFKAQFLEKIERNGDREFLNRYLTKRRLAPQAIRLALTPSAKLESLAVSLGHVHQTLCDAPQAGHQHRMYFVKNVSGIVECVYASWYAEIPGWEISAGSVDAPMKTFRDTIVYVPGHVYLKG